MRLLTWIVGFVVAVTAILFAVSNRVPVSITIWPFPFALDVGLFVIVLASVFAGFVVGALVTWVAQGKHRRKVRRQRSEIRSLEADLAAARAASTEQTPRKAA